MKTYKLVFIDYQDNELCSKEITAYNYTEAKKLRDLYKAESKLNELHRIDIIPLDSDKDEDFVVHGVYAITNAGGFEIMFSKDMSMAKVRDAFGDDKPEISEWLNIESVEDDSVIDPEGYNINVSEIERVQH